MKQKLGFIKRVDKGWITTEPFRADDGLTLETSAFQFFHGGNSTFINSFDKTQFLLPTVTTTTNELHSKDGLLT